MRSLASIAETLRQRNWRPRWSFAATPTLPFEGIAPIDRAGEGEITHLSSPAYRRASCRHRCVCRVARRGRCRGLPVCRPVVVDNPYLAFAVVSQLFEQRPELEAGVSILARRFMPEADIHPDVRIGAFATIGAGAALVGAGVQIGQGALVGERSIVGAGGDIRPRATDPPRRAHWRALSGCPQRCRDRRGRFRLHAPRRRSLAGHCPAWRRRHRRRCQHRRQHRHRPRRACRTPIIGNGVKIDNLVQIGHNCEIGDHTLICGCVGIVGSTKIGRHCVFAGGCRRRWRRSPSRSATT